VRVQLRALSSPHVSESGSRVCSCPLHSEQSWLEALAMNRSETNKAEARMLERIGKGAE
jgi:hypothetical protein